MQETLLHGIMKLYLLRHAEAVPGDPDEARSLSEEGRRTILRLAQFLRDGGTVQPGQVRHSTLKRARETAVIFAETLGLDVPIVETGGLGGLDDVAPLASALSSENQDLVLVGHAPHLERLPALLLTGNAGAGIIKLKAGGMICLQRIEREEARPGWQLLWHLAPALLEKH